MGPDEALRVLCNIAREYAARLRLQETWDGAPTLKQLWQLAKRLGAVPVRGQGQKLGPGYYCPSADRGEPPIIVIAAYCWTLELAARVLAHELFHHLVFESELTPTLRFFAGNPVAPEEAAAVLFEELLMGPRTEREKRLLTRDPRPHNPRRAAWVAECRGWRNARMGVDED